MALLTVAAGAVAGCCLAAIPAVLIRSAAARRRLVQVTRAARAAAGSRTAAGGARSAGRRPAESGGQGGPAETSPASATRRRDPRRLVAALTGVAVALVVGGWPGLAGGVVAAVGTDRALRRLEPPQVRADRAACAADLPLAADLLAAALRSGVPAGRAAAAVAAALGGPLGERLGRTARSLQLGAEPGEAWEHLADVPGAGRLTAAAVRSSTSGGALAGSLTRLADDLRADAAVAAEAAARRAGVLIVLPLGLCFLPAFILAGLAPVIVAVLGGTL